MGYCDWARKYSSQFYFVFRVFVGLLFAQHGAQKLLGWFGGFQGGTVPLLSQFGVAGFIELVGGLCITLGLLTRFWALLSALLMLVAYYLVHLPVALAPIQNKGELALLYFAAFLVLNAYGNGEWSVEKKLIGKELF